MGELLGGEAPPLPKNGYFKGVAFIFRVGGQNIEKYIFLELLDPAIY